eukprot:6703929-Prymnesium_polylepis.1
MLRGTDGTWDNGCTHAWKSTVNYVTGNGRYVGQRPGTLQTRGHFREAMRAAAHQLAAAATGPRSTA